MDKNVYKQLMDQAVPSAALIHKTKSKMKKEKPVMIKRSFSTIAAAVAVVMLLATTAFAARYFLTPSEVAEHFGDQTLSAAFSGENAVNINASQTAGEYTFTLMSIVSGSNISHQQTLHNGQILSDRTYAVVAIQKTNGSPMLFNELAAEEDLFYISPYLSGFQPWQINAHTLKGGGFEVIVDGVKYHLLETDDISIFADRGVYIGITPGRTPPYADGAFTLNEATGEITPNPTFGGINILFNLPLDASHANPEKAQALLDELLGDMTGIIIEGKHPGIGELEVWNPIDKATARKRASENAAAGTWEYNVGEGLVSQKEITSRAEYAEWMQIQRIAGNGDRDVFERYLRFFDEGRTITVRTYEDGRLSIQANS